MLGAAVPTVLTIHNASYTILGPLDETADLVGASDTGRAPGGPIEWFGEANFLKPGVERADVLTTVSPTFANQLLSDGSISGGLDTVLNDRSRPIIGILNAIDTAFWDPRLTRRCLPPSAVTISLDQTPPEPSCSRYLNSIPMACYWAPSPGSQSRKASACCAPTSTNSPPRACDSSSSGMAIWTTLWITGWHATQRRSGMPL